MANSDRSSPQSGNRGSPGLAANNASTLNASESVTTGSGRPQIPHFLDLSFFLPRNSDPNNSFSQNSALPSDELPSNLFVGLNRPATSGIGELAMSSENDLPGSSSDWNSRNVGLASTSSGGWNGQGSSSGTLIRSQHSVCSKQPVKKGIQSTKGKTNIQKSVDPPGMSDFLSFMRSEDSDFGSIARAQNTDVFRQTFGSSSTQLRDRSSSSGFNFNSLFSASGSGGSKAVGSSTDDLSNRSSFARKSSSDSVPQRSMFTTGEPPYGVLARKDMKRRAARHPIPKLSEFSMSLEDFPALPGTSSDPCSTSSDKDEVMPSEGVFVRSQTPASSKQTVKKGPKPLTRFQYESTHSTGDAVSGVFATSDMRRRMTAQPEITESEDFPVLPTSSDWSSTSSAGVIASETSGISDGGNDMSSAGISIESLLPGNSTNNRSSILRDQYGIAGLLSSIQAVETDPNLVSQTHGYDLTTLGLNLDSQDSLYSTFAGSFAEFPCRAQDVDYNVPPEYIINQNIRGRIPAPNLSRCDDDTLFFIFYTNPGEQLQLAAASELFNREWRYHVEKKLWISHAHGCSIVEQTSEYERGLYYLFDPKNWKIVVKDIRIEYSKLAPKPIISTSV